MRPTVGRRSNGNGFFVSDACKSNECGTPSNAGFEQLDTILQIGK
jgi:hypothetical protein